MLTTLAARGLEMHSAGAVDPAMCRVLSLITPWIPEPRSTNLIAMSVSHLDDAVSGVGSGLGFDGPGLDGWGLGALLVGVPGPSSQAFITITASGRSRTMNPIISFLAVMSTLLYCSL